MEIKHVKSGATLQVGRWYRITEIAPSDPNPTQKVGDVLQCAAEKPGCIDPDNHLSDAMGVEWFADLLGADDGFGTLVTGLVEVDAPGPAKDHTA
jgi:hypothetical protein